MRFSSFWAFEWQQRSKSATIDTKGVAARMISTLGHSTLSIDEFVTMCRENSIQTVVDIRSHPTTKWDRFKHEQLSGNDSWLAEAGIGYRWIPALGGWSSAHNSDIKLNKWAAERGVDLSAYAKGYFPKDRISASLSKSDGPSWTNQGLRDYSWFMALASFREAVQLLITESETDTPNPALMCSEYVWWKCHRSMVADYLTWRGVPVCHIMPRPTMHRAILRDRLDRYPGEVKDTWGPRTWHIE